tara:strand:- start:43 stop:426 length:384 start_codon:yes stop_codon:yes gene_type:complete
MKICPKCGAKGSDKVKQCNCGFKFTDGKDYSSKISIINRFKDYPGMKIVILFLKILVSVGFIFNTIFIIGIFFLELSIQIKFLIFFIYVLSSFIVWVGYRYAIENIKIKIDIATYLKSINKKIKSSE